MNGFEGETKNTSTVISECESKPHAYISSAQNEICNSQLHSFSISEIRTPNQSLGNVAECHFNQSASFYCINAQTIFSHHLSGSQMGSVPSTILPNQRICRLRSISCWANALGTPDRRECRPLCLLVRPTHHSRFAGNGNALRCIPTAIPHVCAQQFFSNRPAHRPAHARDLLA